eukprot:2342737-Rhodomonas_salina.1
MPGAGQQSSLVIMSWDMALDNLEEEELAMCVTDIARMPLHKRYEKPGTDAASEPEVDFFAAETGLFPYARAGTGVPHATGAADSVVLTLRVRVLTALMRGPGDGDEVHRHDQHHRVLRRRRRAHEGAGTQLPTSSLRHVRCWPSVLCYAMPGTGPGCTASGTDPGWPAPPCAVLTFSMALPGTVAGSAACEVRSEAASLGPNAPCPGTDAGHYVRPVLVNVLEEAVGEEWTPEMEKVWPSHIKGLFCTVCTAPWLSAFDFAAPGTEVG